MNPKEPTSFLKKNYSLRDTMLRSIEESNLYYKDIPPTSKKRLNEINFKEANLSLNVLGYVLQELLIQGSIKDDNFITPIWIPSLGTFVINQNVVDIAKRKYDKSINQL